MPNPRTVALARLAQQEPRQAELVKLRYFAGLSLEEAAACPGVAPPTAKRWWAVARAWLSDALADHGEAGRR
jgi:DNA-directed RNA polymerase specialized sigma24 family protein